MSVHECVCMCVYGGEGGGAEKGGWLADCRNRVIKQPHCLCDRICITKQVFVTFKFAFYLHIASEISSLPASSPLTGKKIVWPF